MTRPFFLTAVAALAVVGCTAGQQVAPSARSVAPAGATLQQPAAVQATPEPTAPPTVAPAAAPAPTAPPQQAPPPQPAPPPPAPARSVFALSGAGSGSAVVVSQGGSISVTVSAQGLAPGLHATHVHQGCNGSTMAHLLYLSSVAGPSGASSTTLPYAAPGAGWTVIIYPGPSPVGRPVLCAAIG